MSVYVNITTQYVEENERVRAILGEWSTRTATVCCLILVIEKLCANFMETISYLRIILLCDDLLKLERALEAERMSNLELQKKISVLSKQPLISPGQPSNKEHNSI